MSWSTDFGNATRIRRVSQQTRLASVEAAVVWYVYRDGSALGTRRRADLGCDRQGSEEFG